MADGEGQRAFGCSFLGLGVLLAGGISLFLAWKDIVSWNKIHYVFLPIIGVCILGGIYNFFVESVKFSDGKDQEWIEKGGPRE